MSNRIIKESITTSETLALLSGDEERHFFRLLTKADDYGRFDARPHVIRAGLYAAMLDQISTIESERRTLSLASTGLISLYEVEGRRYGQITTWEKHQRVRAKVSKYPPPSSLDSIGGHLTADDNGRQHTPQVATNVAVIQNPNPESRIQNPIPPMVPPDGGTAPQDEKFNDVSASETIKPPDGNPPSKKPTRAAKTTARAAPTLTSQQRAKLVEKWSGVLGNVGDRIDAALAHKSALQWTDMYLHANNWLQRDADKLALRRADPAIRSGAAQLLPNGHDPPAAWRPWGAKDTQMSEAEKESKRQQEEWERAEQRAWAEEFARRDREGIEAARERLRAVARDPTSSPGAVPGDASVG